MLKIISWIWCDLLLDYHPRGWRQYQGLRSAKCLSCKNRFVFTLFSFILQYATENLLEDADAFCYIEPLTALAHSGPSHNPGGYPCPHLSVGIIPPG